METNAIHLKNKAVILALGAESSGNFSVYTPTSKSSPLSNGRSKEGSKNRTVYFSEDFGDLLNEENYTLFEANLNEFLKKEKIRPEIILSDLHPLFRTTELAQQLAKKYGAKHIPVQHHLAHVFSSVGDRFIQNSKFKIQNSFLGIACDGTGYGLDDKIWGGEIFELKVESRKLKVERVGHLENQILIGGEMAIREPARIIISILSKFLSKDEVYKHVKKYYFQQEFEVLYNQGLQNFNCLETSSTARILDAVSILLGFSKNERLSKHGPVDLLEKNSSKPYALKPQIVYDEKEKMWILQTTPLFEYLIKHLDKDKHRLATTAQAYLANGLLELKKEFIHNTKYKIQNTFFSGGMANNKIMSIILTSNGAYVSKKIPRGDAGLSLGQIFYYLLANSRH